MNKSVLKKQDWRTWRNEQRKNYRVLKKRNERR